MKGDLPPRKNVFSKEPPGGTSDGRIRRVTAFAARSTTRRPGTLLRPTTRYLPGNCPAEHSRNQERSRDRDDFRSGNHAVKHLIDLITIVRMGAEVGHHMRVDYDKAHGSACDAQSWRRVMPFCQLRGKRPNRFLVVEKISWQAPPCGLPLSLSLPMAGADLWYEGLSGKSPRPACASQVARQHLAAELDWYGKDRVGWRS